MKKRQRTLFSLILSLLLLFALAPAVSAETMKIAVPATIETKNAAISKKTGRAPFFLFFDANGHFIEAVENPAKDQQRGIRRTVIDLLLAKGVTLVIAENIGDKMKQALYEHHIKYIIDTGVADNAIKKITQNH